MLEGALAPWHLLIIVLLLVVVFGSKKLPEAARSLGRSARILKAETRGLHDDDEQRDQGQPAQVQPQLPPGARFDPYTGAPVQQPAQSGPIPPASAGYPAPPQGGYPPAGQTAPPQGGYPPPPAPPISQAPLPPQTP